MPRSQWPKKSHLVQIEAIFHSKEQDFLKIWHWYIDNSDDFDFDDSSESEDFDDFFILDGS